MKPVQKSTKRALMAAAFCASGLTLCACDSQRLANSQEETTQSNLTSRPSYTPAQRCAFSKTYQAVIDLFQSSFADGSTLRRRLAIGDFSAPLVESVDHDAMSINCSAKLNVPAPSFAPNCATPGFWRLEEGTYAGDEFTFRLRYNLHDTADNTGIQLTLPQSEAIRYATRACAR